jgi:hypothetical protein
VVAAFLITRAFAGPTPLASAAAAAALIDQGETNAA